MENKIDIEAIAGEIMQVAGVEAVVLGGSRGRGNARPDSDTDIGIYFDAGANFDIAALNRLATKWDDEHRIDICTPVGGWGPWVVGGGWLRVKGEPVDFIYRELPRVARVIEDCIAGTVEIGYQAGHPFGFLSSIYMGEVATCKVLRDPHDTLAALKRKTQPYPPALKRALTGMAWEAGFSLSMLPKTVAREDSATLAGHAFRAVMCLTHALFALNEQYCLNEKGAVQLAGTFPLCPPRYAERVNEAFALLGTAPAKSQTMLEQLNAEVQQLLAQGNF
jgi:predicted nucleotidyltransferase